LPGSIGLRRGDRLLLTFEQRVGRARRIQLTDRRRVGAEQRPERRAQLRRQRAVEKVQRQTAQQTIVRVNGAVRRFERRSRQHGGQQREHVLHIALPRTDRFQRPVRITIVRIDHDIAARDRGWNVELAGDRGVHAGGVDRQLRV